MPFWPKDSSQHFNKLKNLINFTITKVITCKIYNRNDINSDLV